MRTDPWLFENRAAGDGYTTIAGVDEAGRGPLAGPVVSAAVVVPENFCVTGVADSKQLSPRKRLLLYDEIYEHAVIVGIGIIDPVEIERINILGAALLSMALAVDNLRPRPDLLLVDGKFNIPRKVPQQAIVKGDALSVSIGAASIVAKVTRDRLMERYHDDYPQYGFAHHKGYPTRAHKAAIREFGCCPIHRRTFKGVREFADPLPLFEA